MNIPAKPTPSPWPAERTGDYLLMQAKLLDAEGRVAESEKILEQGLHLSTSRPRVLQEAALLLLRSSVSGWSFSSLRADPLSRGSYPGGAGLH